MTRWFVPVGALLFTLVCSGLLESQVERNAPKVDPMVEELGVPVFMRDGVRLSADVFLPHSNGRWPTVLVRTPYDRKASPARSYQAFLRRGYAVVIEDVRGRWGSQGTFGAVQQEGPDGNDTINWIAEQNWSNGRVAMAGASYLGIAQWWAALEDNPHLFAISPMCSGDDEYLDRFYSTGGAFKLGHRLLWVAENFTPPFQAKPLFRSYIDHLPLWTGDVTATGRLVPVWRNALQNPSYDDYWKKLSIREQVKQVHVPVLSWGGWFDNYAESDLDMFSRLSTAHRDVETWIGPWAHNPALRFTTIDFGKQPSVPIRATQADWFDYWMGRRASAASERTRALLHIFVMGADIWREEHEWPLARTRYTPLYLGSGGHSNSFSGDGELHWQPIAKEHPDIFTYDPKDPVPTVGGALCCEP
ncbi:MAG: CocE/NonD family hydrolase, partial [Acidobacteriales bacterium]|nr:CocE/NonD family hydrolase [Terriglobales bacterium]